LITSALRSGTINAPSTQIIYQKFGSKEHYTSKACNPSASQMEFPIWGDEQKKERHLLYKCAPDYGKYIQQKLIWDCSSISLNTIPNSADAQGRVGNAERDGSPIQWPWMMICGCDRGPLRIDSKGHPSHGDGGW
jgi:hypothetical protein